MPHDGHFERTGTGGKHPRVSSPKAPMPSSASLTTGLPDWSERVHRCLEWMAVSAEDGEAVSFDPEDCEALLWYIDQLGDGWEKARNIFYKC